MFLVCGLGNPGKEYDKTRHNVGFAAMDILAETYGIKINKIKFKGLCAEANVAGEKVIFLKPQTYMNLSGESVREACAFYKIPTENVIVLYDDISLKIGSVRIRKSGSAGGHNGIKSIIYQLNSDQFPRIRFGIGEPERSEGSLACHVLGHFSKDEGETLFSLIKNAPEMVECIIKNGADACASQYNVTVK